MSTRRHLPIRGALVACSLATGACIAVFGMDPLSERLLSAPLDASASADAEAGVCLPTTLDLPGKPTSAAATTSKKDVYFAFKRLDFGIDEAEGPPGLDLDRQTTTSLEKTSCATRGAEGFDPYGIDGDGGVDNATLPLLRTLAPFLPSMAPEAINARLLERRIGVVLRIEDWNGTSNDDNIHVFVYPAIGWWRWLDDKFVPEGEGPTPPPKTFDWKDVWMLDERFLQAGASSIQSKQAWVNEGRLVARFDELTLPLRSSIDDLRPFDILLSDAWMTGSLVPGGEGARDELSSGVIGGRIVVNKLLEQMGLLFDTTTNTYLCTQTNTLASNSILIGCSARDLAARACDDDKAQPCDALSFGARFDAYPVEYIGTPRKRTREEYIDAGRLPPEERCPGDVKPFKCPD